MSDQSLYQQAGRSASLKIQQTGSTGTTAFPYISDYYPHTSILSAITRLTPDDETLFRNAFQQDGATYYVNSWLYLLRFTRNDEGDWGYKYVSEGALIGIGYRKNTLYLVHPMGEDRFAATQHLVAALRKTFHGPILLKKADEALYQHLLGNELFQACSDSSLLVEEEAYPEHVLPLPLLYNPGGQYHRSGSFLRKVKQFERQDMIQLTAVNDLTNVDQHPGFQQLFVSHPDKFPSYAQMLREISMQTLEHNRYNSCAYVDQTGTIHGIYISERLKEQYWGLYCAISSRAARGITEWMDHNFFWRLFRSGCEALYLGGSETQGVHDYVQKLFPIQPSYCMRPLQIAE